MQYESVEGPKPKFVLNQRVRAITTEAKRWLVGIGTVDRLEALPWGGFRVYVRGDIAAPVAFNESDLEVVPTSGLVVMDLGGGLYSANGEPYVIANGKRIQKGTRVSWEDDGKFYSATVTSVGSEGVVQTDNGWSFVDRGIYRLRVEDAPSKPLPSIIPAHLDVGSLVYTRDYQPCGGLRAAYVRFNDGRTVRLEDSYGNTHIVTFDELAKLNPEQPASSASESNPKLSPEGIADLIRKVAANPPESVHERRQRIIAEALSVCTSSGHVGARTPEQLDAEQSDDEYERAEATRLRRWDDAIKLALDSRPRGVSKERWQVYLANVTEAPNPKAGAEQAEEWFDVFRHEQALKLAVERAVADPSVVPELPRAKGWWER